MSHDTPLIAAADVIAYLEGPSNDRTCDGTLIWHGRRFYFRNAADLATLCDRYRTMVMIDLGAVVMPVDPELFLGSLRVQNPANGMAIIGRVGRHRPTQATTMTSQISIRVQRVDYAVPDGG